MTKGLRLGTGIREMMSLFACGGGKHQFSRYGHPQMLPKAGAAGHLRDCIGYIVVGFGWPQDSQTDAASIICLHVRRGIIVRRTCGDIQTTETMRAKTTAPLARLSPVAVRQRPKRIARSHFDAKGTMVTA